MRQIVLDGSAWKCDGCFYGGVFEALGVPEPESDELDALRDAVLAEGLAFEINGTSKMKAAAKEMVERFSAMIAEAKAQGHPVDVVCNP